MKIANESARGRFEMKKVYSTPKLTVFGDVKELVKNGLSNDCEKTNNTPPNCGGNSGQDSKKRA